MEDTLVKSIFVFISLTVLSALVSIVMFTVSLGMNIYSAATSRVTEYYSEAGLSIMIDAHNLDSIDAPNLYKMLNVNQSVITDWHITDLEGNIIVDWQNILENPTSRYSVNITGDSAMGFEVEAEEIERVVVD